MTTTNFTALCAPDYHHSSSNYYSHSNLSPKNSTLGRDIDINIPPRKLLGRGTRPAPLDDSICMLSPRFSSADETLLQRFLPCNGGDDDDVDPYGSDHFRMFEFKVRRCTRSRSHDWTDCPFAHPGEKARRRDPRRYHYSGTVCSEYRRGGCSRGDNCEFAHGVFECWLHPSRYRTEACKDGKNCKRKVCFFAHTARELRVLPLQSQNSPENSPVAGKYMAGCSFCCHSSPTSTLLGVSPPHSPPLSPIQHRSLGGLSPFSRFLNSEHASGVNVGPHLGGPQFYSPTNSASYKDTLNELICSLEAMRFNDAVSASACSPVSGGENYRNAPWIEDQQQQFNVSNNGVASPSGFGSADRRYQDNNVKINESNGWACDPDPDLGWVNDLLM